MFFDTGDSQEYGTPAGTELQKASNPAAVTAGTAKQTGRAPIVAQTQSGTSSGVVALPSVNPGAQAGYSRLAISRPMPVPKVKKLVPGSWTPSDDSKRMDDILDKYGVQGKYEFPVVNVFRPPLVVVCLLTCNVILPNYVIWPKPPPCRKPFYMCR